MKKIISMVLAVVLTLSSSAFAYTDYEETPDTRLLSTLGIMSGYDENTFAPNDTLTRSQMVKIIVEAFGYGKKITAVDTEGKGFEADESFSDLNKNSWAYPYWQCAIYDMKIINGFEDGTVHPDDNVTYEQLIKMFVSALGYDKIAEENGGYPSGYLVWGSKTGISKRVSFAFGENVIRKNAAVITADTLRAAMYSSDQDINTPVFLMNTMNLYEAEVTVQSVEDNKAKLKIDRAFNFDGKNYEESENMLVDVSLNGAELKNGEKYKVIIEKTDAEYSIKFVY